MTSLKNFAFLNRMKTDNAKILGPAFEQLQNQWKEVGSLNAALSLMYWDQGTYLPSGSAAERGGHMATLEKMAHELATHDRVGQWLEQIEPRLKELPPEADERAMIREARKSYNLTKRIPSTLAAKLGEHKAITYDSWKKARAQEDFGIVQDVLEKSLELSREYASCLKTPEQQSLMDPLIDEHDEGFTEAQVRPLFAELRGKLVPLLNQITARPPADNSCLLQEFPETLQKEFGEKVIKQLGFDFQKGRQDKTEHPFMIRFAHSDIRITTRFKSHDLSEGLFSTVHEAGHALYELGIDPKYDGTPIGGGSSSGIHESQSRLWENLVARGLPFWEHFYPELQKTFPKQLGQTNVREFHRAINRVERSLIRTDADEVTYNLHVMIRFDLESDMIAGRLKIKDLPDAWNARYKSDLGLTPPKLTQGVLQDVHWFHGVIGGAFQGYTIGNILSAQLFKAAERAIPDLQTQFRSGEFKPLREWLRTHLHQFGKKYQGPELIKRATGTELETKSYFDYLETKFLASPN